MKGRYFPAAVAEVEAKGGVEKNPTFRRSGFKISSCFGGGKLRVETGELSWF